MMLVTYEDNYIYLYRDMKGFNELIVSLREGKDNFNLTDHGNIEKLSGRGHRKEKLK